MILEDNRSNATFKFFMAHQEKLQLKIVWIILSNSIIWPNGYFTQVCVSNI
jgi:hypothetical protein